MPTSVLHKGHVTVTSHTAADRRRTGATLQPLGNPAHTDERSLAGNRKGLCAPVTSKEMASSTALEDWNVSLWVCLVYTVTRDAASSDTATVEDEALGCEGTVRARCRNTTCQYMCTRRVWWWTRGAA